ncbi:DNA replication and repair protein RecF [Candidatus Dojkabacteria bacterium]|nr:DNA replication and repair protein RecF [Candidatus Dojkabacteria bacterium]
MQIKKIKLKNFRQFETLEIELHPKLTVLIGDNAQGKSTILEAIHLLTDATSPWTSLSEELVNFHSEETYYRIEGIFHDSENDEDIQVSVYSEDGRKEMKVNQKAKSQKNFTSLGTSNIFSPEQIDILMLSPSKRRDFLNSLASKVNPDYSEYLTKFRKVLRQRNAHLKKLSKKFYSTGEIPPIDNQLEFWTKELANFSAKLMAARTDIVQTLNDYAESQEYKYNCSLKLNLFEDMTSAETLEKIHLKQLIETIRKDIARGYTNIGAHRDDWDVFDKLNKVSSLKNVRKFGSRGEKRFAVGKLIFDTQELIYKLTGQYPILLLDDISSELDNNKQDQLIQPQILEKQQSFITAISKNGWFEKLPKDKKLIYTSDL